MLALFIILLLNHSASCIDEVAIMGGKTPYEGVVEVLISDQNIRTWMRICGTDKDWTMSEADVICRQLGFPGAMFDSADVGKPKSYWAGMMLRGVHCQGNETTFKDCEYDDFEEDCRGQSATVSCNYEDYLGCFPFNNNVAPTNYGKWSQSENMTIQHCLNFCHGKYLYAGTTNGGFCYCGNASYERDEVLANENCNTPCAGNGLQSCGGPSSIGLYKGIMGICDSYVEIKRDSGSIYSPGFPGSYTSHLFDCSWYITTTKTTFIRSRFVIFALRNVQDTVIIDDLSMTESQRLSLHYTKLNDSNPFIPDMLSNRMKVTFLTQIIDTSNAWSIFVIEFEATNCNQPTLLTGQGGRIYSRGFPKCNESDQNVKTWTISAPNGTVVEKSFINCKLPHKSVSVVMTDVGDGKQIKKYTCEDLNQRRFFSTSNILVIVLESSGKSSENSDDEVIFILEWKATLKSYTANRTGQHGILMSPFYPYPFPSHIFYTWYVTTDKYSLVKILFIEFSLREKDFLEIGHDNKTRSSLGRYNSSKCCGLPKVPYSKSNQVVVGLSSEKEPKEVTFTQEGRIAIVYYAVWKCSFNDSIENGSWKYNGKQKFLPGETLVLPIKMGYSSTINCTITCNENGTWNSTLYACAGRPENGSTENLDPRQGNNDTFKCSEAPTNGTICHFNGTQDEKLPMINYIVVVCSAGSVCIVILILLIICWRQRSLCKASTSNTQDTRCVTLSSGRQKRATQVFEEFELPNIEKEMRSSYSDVSVTSAEQTGGRVKQPLYMSLILPDSEDRVGDTTRLPSPNEAIEGVQRVASSSVSVRRSVKNGIPDIDFEEARFKEKELNESGDDFEVVEYAVLEDQDVGFVENMHGGGSTSREKHTGYLARVETDHYSLLHENQPVTLQQESNVSSFTSQHTADDNFEPQDVHGLKDDALICHRESLLPERLRHSYEEVDEVCLSGDIGSVANIVYESYTESHPESADESNPGGAIRETNEDVHYSTIKDNDQFQ
ncbi:uncharacterized protein [Ptychodera flava]|uniref:uncharacterized protein n=1 Tax=Ptychodera flava TaxID=63121 RepID=UPI00396A86A6